MRCECLDPADQIVLVMDRIYQHGLTTTSGGNLSVYDEKGNVWITPSGIDKGSLTRGDICRVDPDGTVYGPHKPSVELPFHLSVYRARPDIKAILHAHPPMLVSFSIARVIPDVSLVAAFWQNCSKPVMAPYAVPGSQELGDSISRIFSEGYDVVMLENHGAVVGASDLSAAFIKFETLEVSAKLEICARRLGHPVQLTEQELNLSLSDKHLVMGEFRLTAHSAEECEARRDMAKLIHRAYRQKLFTGAQGTYSSRLDDSSFLITPDDLDRAYIEGSDLVHISRGMKERGKNPSRFILLHQAIYDRNPEVQSIINASPPYVTAFAVTDEPFNPRTIPESYILLRESGKIPYADIYDRRDEVAALFSNRKPLLICRSNTVISTGDSMLSAYDRLEVAEATAHSIIEAGAISNIVHISDKEIEKVERAFNL